jgi:predicted O-methyltransferase YrrM
MSVARRWGRRVLHHVPLFGRILQERDELRRAYGFVPPGHFYSPLPSLDDVRRDAERLWHAPRDLPGIDLREPQQLQLLDEFARYYREQPFPERRRADRRYYFENSAYSYSDAIVFYCMMRHASPKRIVEIGSGYSSCVALDTNELFFDNQMACVFVEPYPDLLLSLIRAEDRSRVTIIPRRLQDVGLDVFHALEANDFLFIDSTHVAKIGSDVNHIMTQILPTLRVGVYVHFHDIPYPFEYFRDWIEEGRAWNEAYMVRAFLSFNSAYEIVFFNTFLERFHRERFAALMPLCLRNEGGSLWIRRVS